MSSNKPILIANVPPKHEVISLDSDEDDYQMGEHHPGFDTHRAHQNDIETLLASDDEQLIDSLSPILDKEIDVDESSHDSEIDDYMRAVVPLAIGWKNSEDATSNFDINDISNIIKKRKHTEETTKSPELSDHSILQPVAPISASTQVPKKKTTRATKKTNNKSDNNKTDTASTSVSSTQVYSKGETDVTRPKKKSKKRTPFQHDANDTSSLSVSSTKVYSTDNTEVEQPKKKSKRQTPVQHDANDTSSLSVSSTKVYSTDNTEVDTVSTSTIPIEANSDSEETETTKSKRKTKPKITAEDYSLDDYVEYKTRENEIIDLSDEEYEQVKHANELKQKLKVYTDKLKIIRQQRKAVEKTKRERVKIFRKHVVARDFALARDNPELADNRYTVTCPRCKQVVSVELGVIHSNCGYEHDLEWVDEQYTLLQCFPDKQGLKPPTHRCESYVCFDTERQIDFDELMENEVEGGLAFYTFSNKTHKRVDNALNHQPKEIIQPDDIEQPDEIKQPDAETKLSGKNDTTRNSDQEGAKSKYSDLSYSLSCPRCKQVVVADMDAIHSGCFESKTHTIAFVEESFTKLVCIPATSRTQQITHKLIPYWCLDDEKQERLDSKSDIWEETHTGVAYFDISNKTHLEVKDDD